MIAPRAGARCAWSVNDKGEIDICSKNGCVTYPSGDVTQCTVASRGQPRPVTTLPVGAIVMTSVGMFSVTPGGFSRRCVHRQSMLGLPEASTAQAAGVHSIDTVEINQRLAVAFVGDNIACTLFA